MSEIRKQITRSITIHEKNSGPMCDELKSKMEGRIRALENMGDPFDEFIMVVVGRPIKDDERFITEDLKFKFQGMMAAFIDTALDVSSLSDEMTGKFVWGEFWRAIEDFQTQMLFCMTSVTTYRDEERKVSGV